eukprot:4998146-Amphidinium_carterae.1
MTDVRASTGDTRQKWIEAAQKELDTLLTSKTISSITLTQREELNAIRKCRRSGGQYSELPCKPNVRECSPLSLASIRQGFAGAGL